MRRRTLPQVDAELRALRDYVARHGGFAQRKRVRELEEERARMLVSRSATMKRRAALLLKGA